MRIIYLIFSSLFFISIQEEQKSQYIIEESDIQKLLPMLSNKEFSLILIYSPYCPHCRNFHPHYNRLAEKYHDKIHFYRMNAIENNSYRKHFTKIRGYPSLWFYFNDTYTEFKKAYTFDTLDKYITDNYFFECDTLKNEDLHSLLNQTKKFPKFVGAFLDKKTEQGKIFSKIAIEKKHLVEKCFFFDPAGQDNFKHFTGSVLSYTDQRGFNEFKLFSLFNDTSERVVSSFNQFIEDTMSEVYISIEKEIDANNLFEQKKQGREFVFFTYTKKKKNYEEDVKEYLNQINYLSMLSESKKDLFTYVLYDISKNFRSLKKYKFASDPGIYLSSNDLSKIKKMQNTTMIEKIIVEQSLIEEREREEKKAKEDLINEHLKALFYDKESKGKAGEVNWRKVVFFLFDIVIYSIIYFYFYKNYLADKPVLSKDIEEKAELNE